MDCWAVLEAAHAMSQEATMLINANMESFDPNWLMGMIAGIEANPESELVSRALYLIKHYYVSEASASLVIPGEITNHVLQLCYARVNDASEAVRKVSCDIIAGIILRNSENPLVLEIYKNIVESINPGNLGGHEIGLRSALDIIAQLFSGGISEPAISIRSIVLLRSQNTNTISLVLDILRDSGSLDAMREYQVQILVIMQRIYQYLSIDDLKVPCIMFIRDICSEFPEIIPDACTPLMAMTIEHFRLYDAIGRGALPVPENFRTLEEVIMQLSMFWEEVINHNNNEVNVAIAQQLMEPALSLVQCVDTTLLMEMDLEWGPTSAVQSVIAALSHKIPVVTFQCFSVYIPANIDNPHSGIRESVVHCLLHTLTHHPDELLLPQSMEMIQRRLQDPAPRVKSFALLCLRQACQRFGAQIALPFIEYLFACIPLNDISTKFACETLMLIGSMPEFPATEAFYVHLVASVSICPPMYIPSLLQCFNFALVHTAYVPRCIESLLGMINTLCALPLTPDTEFTIQAVCGRLGTVLMAQSAAPECAQICPRVVQTCMAVYDNLRIDNCLPVIAQAASHSAEFMQQVFPALRERSRFEMANNMNDGLRMKSVVLTLSIMVLCISDTEAVSGILDELFAVGSQCNNVMVLKECIDTFADEKFLAANVPRLIHLISTLMELLGDYIVNTYASESQKIVTSVCSALEAVIGVVSPLESHPEIRNVICAIIQQLATNVELDDDLFISVGPSLEQLIVMTQSPST